jgi:hypothetical protein
MKELAEKYFSSPEDCFIKDDETLRGEELVSIRAPIRNSMYSQIIQRKITPHACNNIRIEFHNNRIEEKKDDTTAIVVYKYPLKCEPQEKTPENRTSQDIQSPTAISNVDQGIA